MKSKNQHEPVLNYKTIIAASVMILILILSISLFFIINDVSQSATIRFMIAPSSAQISLDDMTFQSAETYNIAPGEYNLTISKDGFLPYQKTITLNEEDTLNLNIALEVAPGNEDYYEKHPEEAYALETIWANQMMSSGEEVLKKAPLISLLPIEVEYYIQGKQYVHYQITFRVDSSNQVTILINDYTGGNHDAALERIRSEGYNPQDYSIKYQDHSQEYINTDNF